MTIRFYIMLFIYFLLPQTVNAQHNMQVTFINPGFSTVNNPTGEFWPSVSSAMQAAADDLEVDLEIIYSDRNHIQMNRIAKQVLSRSTPPDYLIVVNEKNSAEKIVETAEQKGVNIFLMLNSFEGRQRLRMGSPRSKYKHWIGSLIPNNYYAGYLSATQLIDQALRQGIKADDGNLHLIGYSGDSVTQASIARVAGLEKAISEYPNVLLKQVVSADWSKEIAKHKTLSMLKRYPQLGAIWSANDPIALGALEGAKEMGKSPGEDILFSGINWDSEALKKIQKEQMVTSLGGHFMTGAWALVALYDYHNGKDFIDEGLELEPNTFQIIDNYNVNHYLRKFSEKNWEQIDFTDFSKTLNSSLKQYNFRLRYD